MPALSCRADRMPASPIRRLVDHAVRAEAEGVRVHYLNIGQPDLHSPAEFWEATRGHDLRVLEYAHSAGTAGLREAYAEDLGRKEIRLAPNEVMVTNGGSEACLIAFLTALDPGDEAVTVEPFYANYQGFAVAAGVTLRPLTARIEDDFALPDPEAIEAAITPKTRAILLCNPSNPTGQVFPEADLRRIAALAQERNLFLMVDEVYRDFYYGREKLTSVLEIEGLDERAIMVDSASKKFSLCGARVGFLASRSPAFMAAALKFGQARLAAPTLEMMGVEACLRGTPPSYFAAVREEYMARRDHLVARLRGIPGVVVPHIEGAFYAVVRLPVEDAERFCEWLVTEFRHEGQTVLLAPARGFYLTPGLGQDEVRVAYVLDRERLDQAMNCLEAALKAYAP